MILLSILILLLLFLGINQLAIIFFNTNIFFLFNEKIFLLGFLILSIIYIFYFVVMDFDQSVSKEKQEKIIKHMDYLVIVIFLLSFVFSPFYNRFLYDELFFKLFVLRHNLTLGGLFSIDNIKLLFFAFKYFVIFTTIGGLLFVLELLSRLLIPKNFFNFLEKIFTFNFEKIDKEIQQEEGKKESFFIKNILLIIIKIVLFIYKKIIHFIDKITNHKFNLEIGYQIVDSEGNILAKGTDKDYIENKFEAGLNGVQQNFDGTPTNYNNATFNNGILDNSKKNNSGNNISGNSLKKEINNKFNEENLKIPEGDVVLGSVLTPKSPDIIEKINESKEKNQDLSNFSESSENDFQVKNNDLLETLNKLESVNFPVHLIKNGKIYFENNCIFLNKASLKFKEYIIKYYNSIITDKNNLKKIDNIKDIFIIVYYDPIYGLVLIPKIISRWSITAISNDVIKYFDSIFLKADYFPVELKDYFVENVSSLEKISNSVIYYIVIKHEYNGANRLEYPTQYKPFHLEDLFKQYWGENYKERLDYLQNLNEEKYKNFSNDERLKLLTEKYGIFFGKRKLSLAKDIKKDFIWEEINKKLIFNNTIYKTKHMALLGNTGWGKTVLLRNILYSLLAKNEINGLELYMIDPKSELIKEFYNFKQVKFISTDTDKHRNLIRYLANVMTERQSIIPKSDWTETFETTGKLFHPIILVIEEFVDLSSSLDPFTKSLITKLLVKGRSSGIYVIAVAQYYRAEVFGSVGSQFTLMSVFNDDPVSSKKLTGNEKSLSKLSMGEMLYIDAFNQARVRVPYESDYSKYLNPEMFRYKGEENTSETWKVQKLKFNIEFFLKMLKLYFDDEYSISSVCAKVFNERISWISDFLKFELVYIYIILTKTQESISFTKLISRNFIVKTLLKAIDERREQYNLYEEIESKDTKGFLKNIQTEIVSDFSQLFEKNINIFSSKKLLFDRNIIKKLASAREEADPMLIEELENKIDPEVKVNTIIKILNNMIEGFLNVNIFNEINEFINFFKKNEQLVKEYFQVSDQAVKKIKEIKIDSNLSAEKKFTLFISELALILKEEFNGKENDKNNENNIEKVIEEDIENLNKKYLSSSNKEEIKKDSKKNNKQKLEEDDIDVVIINNNNENPEKKIDIDSLL